MLTRLAFKNWRSLRNVTIDNLTPITVFVGANSAGKTNILDALHFVRYAEQKGVLEAAFVWRVMEKVRTIGVKIGSSVELELTHSIASEIDLATEKYTLSFDAFKLTDGSRETLPSNPLLPVQRESDYLSQNFSYVTSRWQLLREGFLPPSMLTADSSSDTGDLYVVEPDAGNVPLMVNFMQQSHPEIYRNLEADLQWLLSNVSQLGTIRDDKETRYFLEEKSFLGHESPTISAGTSRLIAILTAYYALDMVNKKLPGLIELPGLVVIEEPDTAIHPLLLRNFVELLRTYTMREGYPRQFILTTHNPMFLNMFNPDEVRIVERDEHGETSVSPINMNVANAWLEHDGAYNLGDLWTTRLLGGVPE